MSAVVAFLGFRGAVVAGALGLALLAVGGWGGWQWVRAERAIFAEGMAKSSESLAVASLTTCLQANDSARFAEDARRRMAEANTRVYMAALDNAREAAERARKDKADAERLVAEWRKTWGDKTATCTAALQTLDNACPELRRY